MLVLGDAHASEPGRRDTLLELYDLPAPTWFIAGNNELFDVIEPLRAGETVSETNNVHLLASTAATVDDHHRHHETEIESLDLESHEHDFGPDDVVGE